MSDKSSGANLSSADFFINIFSDTFMCQHEKLFGIEDYSYLVNSNVDENKLLELTKDYLRHVVAHALEHALEHALGHALGLRHNFAGFHASNIDLSEKESLFDSYLRNEQVKIDCQITSSVMDYLPFKESTLETESLV